MHQQSVDLILRRCRALNCIYEGQTFSFGIMASEFSDRQSASAAMAEMQSSGLLSINAHGAFALTKQGADTIVSHALTEDAKPKRTGWQATRNSQAKQRVSMRPPQDAEPGA